MFLIERCRAGDHCHCSPQQNSKCVNIFSGFQAAVRAFVVSTIVKKARGILNEKDILNHILTWFPAHMGHFEGGPTNLNELVHSKA